MTKNLYAMDKGKSFFQIPEKSWNEKGRDRMKQKVLSILLCTSMILSVTPAVYGAETVTAAEETNTAAAEITTMPFTDVPYYFADAALWAYSAGIANGTSATTFSPTMACSRAQMVTFLWKLAGAPAVEGEMPFWDVPENVYYYDAVLWAAQEGIAGGTGPDIFSPDATCSRGQMVTFLWNMAGRPEVDMENPFIDISPEDDCYEAALWAVQEGITAGTSTITFGSNDLCQRWQVITFLYQMEQ